MLARMIDFEKNLHAKEILSEFSAATPEYLSKFSMENLIRVDRSRRAILSILKAYIF